jgi:hypothetical protein
MIEKSTQGNRRNGHVKCHARRNRIERDAQAQHWSKRRTRPKVEFIAHYKAPATDPAQFAAGHD